MEQDANHAWEYARMLRHSADAIVNALMCASLLGGLSPAPDPHEKLINGLSTLSGCLSLENLPEDETISRLNNAMSALKGLIGVTIPTMRENDFPAWGNKLAAAMKQVAEGAAVGLNDLPKAREAAYLTWSDRFTEFQTYGTTNFTPKLTAEDLLLAASDHAFQVLRLDLAEMTIAEGMEVLRCALRTPDIHFSPLAIWFAIPALVCLGFTRFARSCAAAREGWIKGEADRELVRRWTDAISPRWSHGVLILVPEDRREPFGLTARWKPYPAGYASTWSTQVRWSELQHLLGRIAGKGSDFDLIRDLDIRTILLEVLDDDHTDIATLGSPTQKIETAVDVSKLQFAYVTSRVVARPSNAPLIISAPDSLYDAMMKLTSMSTLPPTSVAPPSQGPRTA